MGSRMARRVCVDDRRLRAAVRRVQDRTVGVDRLARLPDAEDPAAQRHPDRP
jgi:hypothetical protein